MELRVVGVLVILYAVVSDDVGDWAAVDCLNSPVKEFTTTVNLGSTMVQQGYTMVQLSK